MVMKNRVEARIFNAYDYQQAQHSRTGEETT
jgi:hypothetical protein